MNLIEACKTGNLEEVKRLIENGADVHTCDNYPLRMAAIEGHLDIVKYLIRKGQIYMQKTIKHLDLQHILIG